MPSVLHPYPQDILLLHNFSGSLLPEVGGAFAADGCALTTSGAIFGMSLDVLGDTPGGGGSNVLYSVAPSAQYDLNAGDLTIEGWWTFRTAPTRPRTLIRIADNSSAAGNSEFQLYNDGAGRTFFADFPIGEPVGFTQLGTIDTQIGIVLNTPMHMALVRLGDLYTCFVQGVPTAFANPQTYRRAAGPKQVFSGNSQRAFVDGHDGVVDALAITRRALYTTAFTPPEGPYALPLEGTARVWPAGAPQ